MKKIKIIVLLILFSASLVGCRETEVNTDGDTEEPDAAVDSRAEAE